MNRKTLNKHLKRSPKFFQKECFDVSIEHVEIDNCSQTRQSTEVQSHIDRLAQSMIDSGRQEVPVTVEEYYNADGEQRYKLRDGNHRFGAILKNSQHPDENIRSMFQTILAHERKFSSLIERENYQWEQNDHDVVLCNREEDAVHLINKRMQRNAIKDAAGTPITSTNYQNSTSNAQVIASSLKSLGVAKSSVPTVVSKVEKTTYNGQVKTWGPTTVTRSYRDFTHSNWDGSKPGEASQGEAVYHLNGLGRISPNLTGAVLRRLVKDQEEGNKSRTKTSVVAWLGDCVHKSGSDVDDYRKAVVKSINKLNETMTTLGLGPMITGELVFMPQKLGTKKESKCIPSNYAQTPPKFAKRAKKLNKTIKDNNGNDVTFETFKL